MAPSIQIEISEDVYRRLQALAKPFVDSPETVITQLLDFREAAAKSNPDTSPAPSRKKVQPMPAAARFFVTSRGERIPLGKLRAVYGPRGRQKHEFSAEVTSSGIKFLGQLYDNPSPAGIAAKESVGAEGAAASTNGWDFWEYFNASSGTWISIDTFRGKPEPKLTLEDLDL